MDLIAARIGLTVVALGLMASNIGVADLPPTDDAPTTSPPSGRALSRDTSNAKSYVVVTDVQLSYAERVDIPSTIDGVVERCEVKLNQVVDRGDLIASLDDSAIRLGMQTAKLRLASAMRNATDTTRIDYARVVRSAAVAEYEQAVRMRDDSTGSVSQTKLRQLKLAVGRGEMDVTLAIGEQIDASEEVDVLRSELAELEFRQNQTRIVAPFAGVIIDVRQHAGGWVRRGDPVATLASVDRLRVDGLCECKMLHPSRAVGGRIEIWGRDAKTGLPLKLAGGIIESIDPGWVAERRFRFHSTIENPAIASPSDVAPQGATRHPSKDSVRHPTVRSLAPGMPVSGRIYPNATR